MINTAKSTCESKSAVTNAAGIFPNRQEKNVVSH